MDKSILFQKVFVVGVLGLMFFALTTRDVVAQSPPPTHAQEYPFHDVAKGSCSSGGGCFIDPWRFYERECTSYVAWRLNNEFKLLELDFLFSNDLDGDGGIDLGSAISWVDGAARLGYKVNYQPQVGSVAYWSNYSSGHVAYVESINVDGTVNVSEYRSNSGGIYSYTQGVRAEKYIHIYSDQIAQRYTHKELDILANESSKSLLLLPDSTGVALGELKLEAKDGNLRLALSRNTVTGILSATDLGRVLGITTPNELQILWEATYVPSNKGYWMWTNIEASRQPEIINIIIKKDKAILTIFTPQYDQQKDVVSLQKKVHDYKFTSQFNADSFQNLTPDQIRIVPRRTGLTDMVVIGHKGPISLVLVENKDTPTVTAVPTKLAEFLQSMSS